MCLIINRLYHKAGGENDDYMPCPLTAQEDILVYKLLLHLPWGGAYTPYQMMPISFLDGRYYYDSTFTFALNLEQQDDCVIKGCHAYHSYDSAEWIDNGTFNSRIHRAVIPKGTKFYVGRFGDIVSEKLIVINDLDEETGMKGLEPITFEDYTCKYLLPFTC